MALIMTAELADPRIHETWPPYSQETSNTLRGCVPQPLVPFAEQPAHARGIWQFRRAAQAFKAGLRVVDVLLELPCRSGGLGALCSNQLVRESGSSGARRLRKGIVVRDDRVVALPASESPHEPMELLQRHAGPFQVLTHDPLGVQLARRLNLPHASRLV